jgi:hypothetical protein
MIYLLFHLTGLRGDALFLVDGCVSSCKKVEGKGEGFKGKGEELVQEGSSNEKFSPPGYESRLFPILCSPFPTYKSEDMRQEAKERKVYCQVF